MSSANSRRRTARALRFVAAAIAMLACNHAAQAQCPVGTKITIDYDIPNSGYSEESSNWTTWNTAPCNGAGYRYLSHTVGDGSRRGKATWKPNIAVAGHYKVLSGYRATTNRTNDADYFSYDDHGAVVHKVVNQSSGDGCEWVDLGRSWCDPGGSCRVVLDGTDDDKSDCADVTVYELVDCDSGTGGTGGGTGGTGGGTAGRCDGIRMNAAWEVCEETDTTCKGVFTDGAGCTAYCAAAGMTCTARFGGEPGCQKELQVVLACGANNGHASDWCECEGQPLPQDAGTGGTAGAGGAGGAATGGAAGEAGSGGGGAAGWIASGGASPDGSAAGAGGSTSTGGSSGSAGSPANGDGSGSDDGGCACRAGTAPVGKVGWAVVLGIALGAAARRKHRR